MMKKPNTEILKKLPKRIVENLDGISKKLHGKPLSMSLAKELKIGEQDAKDLLQYMCDIGLITLKWLPGKGLCMIRRQMVN